MKDCRFDVDWLFSNGLQAQLVRVVFSVTLRLLYKLILKTKILYETLLCTIEYN